MTHQAADTAAQFNRAQHEALLELRRILAEAAETLPDNPTAQQTREFNHRTRRLNLRFRVAQAILRAKPPERQAQHAAPATDARSPSQPSATAAATPGERAAPNAPRPADADRAPLPAPATTFTRSLNQRAHAQPLTRQAS